MKAENYGASVENIELSTDGIYLQVMTVGDDGKGHCAHLTPKQVRHLIAELTIYQKLKREGFDDTNINWEVD